MRSKTKTVDIGGTKYQVGRLSAKDGSYIHWKLIGAARRAAEVEMQKLPAAEVVRQQAETPATPEERVRILIAVASDHLDYETHGFIQDRCLATCMRGEIVGPAEAFIPICSAVGQIAIPEVAEDTGLVMRLVAETLVFNLSDFFGESALNAAGDRGSSR